METSGRVKFEVGVAGRSAVLVVLDENISIARYWPYVSDFQLICYLNKRTAIRGRRRYYRYFGCRC